MFVVHTIPIARGVGKETLSYFSQKPLEIGAVVHVPLRKKSVPAIVVDLAPARDVKATLRKLDYPLKKITSRKKHLLFSPAFMRAVQDTSRYFASTTGATLYAVTPRMLWDAKAAEHIAKGGVAYAGARDKDERNVEPERLVFQAEDEERLSRYRSVVRESFARGKSVVLCTPTIQEGEHLYANLAKGIEGRIHFLHGSLTKKEQLARWLEATRANQSILFIATPQFLALERPDFATIIVEREQAPSYKHMARPFIDMRMFIAHLARARGARLILAGMPLRVETLWRHYRGAHDALVPIKLHPQSSVRKLIVDMRERERAATPPAAKKKEFQVISPELAQLIADTSATRNSRLFIFCARRGLAPITVCLDCGNPVTCEDSNEPAVLYRGISGNMFVCHSTGASRSAHERCRSCGSWRLQTLGIGLQLVEQEIHTQLPDVPLVVLDGTTARTHKQARAIAEKFCRSRGTVLVGTEMALPYLTAPVPSVAVASADALLAHPEWYMSEKTFALLLALQQKATDTFLIQTRRPDEPIVHYALAGDTIRFYREEIARRNLLKYPPHTVLIKLTFAGTPPRAHKEAAYLEQYFKDYKLHIYLPTVHTSRGHYSVNGLLRVPRDAWPDDRLLSLLRGLPPHIAVNVDPTHLLQS